MRKIVLLWDNFGPMHVDRLEATATEFAGRAEVVGCELFSKSLEYAWVSPGSGKARIETLSDSDGGGARPGRAACLRQLIGFRWRVGQATWFLCHYERPEVLAFAWWLRLTGARVHTMGCSKFDDQPRRAGREWLKSFFLAPYRGAIGSGRRSADYFSFLGLSPGRVVGEYNTVSIERLRRLAGVSPAPGGLDHAERHFVCVARFVPKKNLHALIEAYALYAGGVETPRRLHLCGSGALEEALREQVAALGLEGRVIFEGFLQSDAVARLLGRSLALLLPSLEEQFGNVVIEAQALGLPVILSDNCGARDKLVRSAVNGFVVEPDNPEGMAWFMRALDADPALWRRLSEGAAASAALGDAPRFAEAVRRLADA